VALVAALVAAGPVGRLGDQERAGRTRPPPSRKVQLSGIVGEYVQAQARSATPPEQVTAETRAFMGEVQRNLEARGAAGQIVLVGEAVLPAMSPTSPPSVRKEVYTKVKMPQPRLPILDQAANDVMGAMRAAMAGPSRKRTAWKPGNACQLPPATEPNAFPVKRGPKPQARHRCPRWLVIGGFAAALSASSSLASWRDEHAI
jgi:hypothetical protein